MNLYFLAQTAANPQRSSVSMIIMLVVLFALMYFLMIRPQRKKQKEEQKMRENIEVGDEVTTIGGICGRVVTVKEDTFVIETGADRNKMKITKWAIQTNNTANERLAAEREAAKKAAEEAKAEKMAQRGKKRGNKSEDDK